MQIRVLAIVVTLSGLFACGDDTAPAGGGGVGGEASGGAAAGGEAAGGEAPTSVRECNDDEDCVLQDDCCACASLPTDSVGACDLKCVQSSCSALGIAPEAMCEAGQCVFTLSCDAATVTCDAAPPNCSPGTVASVDGACWGPCIAATECREVTSCADCGPIACLDEVAFTVTHHCIANVEACPSGPDCDCLDELCQPDDLCVDGLPDADVTCECINC